MSNLERDFTQGSIGKKLVKFSLPFLLSNLLQALYGVADIWVVSQFASPDQAVCNAALAGVNTGTQVTHLIAMAVSGLTVAGTVLVGQYIGAQKREEAGKTVGTLFTVLGILGAALTVVMMVLSTPLLRLLNTPAESFPHARQYLDICLLGTIFVFGYNAISSIQRGLGDSVRPLIFVGIAAVINVGIDLWFVWGLGMGAAGAAWATIISQAISLILAGVYLARSKFVFDFKLRSFKIHKDKLRMMLKIGLPSSVQSIIVNISFLVMTALVNTIGGVTASAAVGVAGKMNSFAILPTVAMSSSISAFAAQNIGAGQLERARKGLNVGVIIACAFGLAMFAVMQLIPDQVLLLFNAAPEVVASGVTYIRAFSFDYLILPTLFCMNGLIMGAGHTFFTLLTGALSSLLLRIPVAYILGTGSLGLVGVGMAAPIASVLSLGCAAWFVLSGRWQVNKTGISREPMVLE